jgi:serine/threonine protein kinase
MGNLCVTPPKAYEPDMPAPVIHVDLPPLRKSLDVKPSTPTLGTITNTGLTQQQLAQQALGDITFIGLLGVGGFGRVYKASLHGQYVAVKVVPQSDDFVNEAEISASLDHPNVVHTLIHTVRKASKHPLEDGSPSTIIVMEFCDRGGLQSAVEKGTFVQNGNRNQQWIIETLLDVARGMGYLHTKGVVHADLNTRNVMLSSSDEDKRGFTAKVADFGMSHVFRGWSRTHKSTSQYGTLTHVPPEMLGDGKLSPKADQYAFGIMMWEMWTRQKPFSDYYHGQLISAVCGGERPLFTEDAPLVYQQLAQRCWHEDKAVRPDWTDIMQTLQLV